MTWTMILGTCHVCGKFGVMKSKKSKRCDSCIVRGYTIKRNPYKNIKGSANNEENNTEL